MVLVALNTGFTLFYRSDRDSNSGGGSHSHDLFITGPQELSFFFFTLSFFFFYIEKYAFGSKKKTNHLVRSLIFLCLL